jgi:tRNA threonylcarbamoyladenosine modification (KEOPS) complex Cgi121 subunit
MITRRFFIMSDNSVFSELKELMQQQIKEAYMEGVHKGAETTCAIIYQTMKMAGLEEDNFLFYILNDIARQHGCEDLPALAEKIQNKEPTSNGEIPS